MSRGILFGIIGIYLVVAAVQVEPGEAKGIGGTLQTIQALADGQVLLGLIAAGLVAFAVYGFIPAFYRRIDPAPRVPGVPR